MRRPFARGLVAWRAMLVIACVAGPGAAYASCSVDAQSVDFGAYDFRSNAALESVGHIVVTCDSAADYQVMLSPGVGTYGQRLLTSGGHALGYNLYVDLTHTTVWGDGAAGTVTAHGHMDGTGAATDLVIYGLVPARQNPVPGIYSDAIVVTLTF